MYFIFIFKIEMKKVLSFELFLKLNINNNVFGVVQLRLNLHVLYFFLK